MGVNIVKCPSCGMNYNGDQYTICPWCRSGSSAGKNAPAKKAEEKKSAGKGHGFFGHKKKAAGQTAEAPAPQQEIPVAAEPAVSAVPVAPDVPAAVVPDMPAAPDRTWAPVEQAAPAPDPVAALSDTGRTTVHTLSEPPKTSIHRVSDSLDVFPSGNLSTGQIAASSGAPKASQGSLRDRLGLTDSVIEAFPVPPVAARGSASPAQAASSPAPVASAALETAPEMSQAPSAADQPSPFEHLGKTTAKFISSSSGETIYPVVGWLVCVRGIYYGKGFPLRSGINRIGRSSELEISLPGDNSVSAIPAAKLTYDPRTNVYNILPGNSTSLCYVNGNALYSLEKLQGFEEIEFGDAEQNMFVFVPLCGSSFQWSRYPAGPQA